MLSSYSTAQKQVQEPLSSPKSRFVEFLRAVDRTETPSEFPVQRICIVSLDVEAAAFRRSFTSSYTIADPTGVPEGPGYSCAGTRQFVRSDRTCARRKSPLPRDASFGDSRC